MKIIENPRDSTLLVGDVIEGKLTLSKQTAIEYTLRVVDRYISPEGYVVLTLEFLDV